MHVCLSGQMTCSIMVQTIPSRRQKSPEISGLGFFGTIVIAFGMLSHCPIALYLLQHHMFNLWKRKGTFEPTWGGGRKKEWVCRTCCWLPASVLLYMSFEPGRNTCLGLQKQHMVVLCKTKGHVKADVAFFKSLQGHKAFEERERNKK